MTANLYLRILKFYKQSYNVARVAIKVPPFCNQSEEMTHPFKKQMAAM